MAGPVAAIRHWLDLLEAITNPWGVSKSSLFDDSAREMSVRVPDLKARIKRFIGIKLPNPIGREALVGSYDRVFTGDVKLRRFWHCHLGEDVVLIYRLENHSVQLMLVCQHKDIEGKRKRATAKRLTAASMVPMAA